MNTVGFEKNTGRGKFPWLLLLSVIGWYLLYSLGLWAAHQLPLDWLIAVTTATLLAAAIATSQLLSIPLFLLATWLLAVRLLIDSLIARGSEDFGQLVHRSLNNGWQGMAISAALTLLLSLFWFSPLFFVERRMRRRHFLRGRIFLSLAIASWSGLGLGWLISRTLGT